MIGVGLAMLISTGVIGYGMHLWLGKRVLSGQVIINSLKRIKNNAQKQVAFLNDLTESDVKHVNLFSIVQSVSYHDMTDKQRKELFFKFSELRLRDRDKRTIKSIGYDFDTGQKLNKKRETDSKESE